MSDTMFGPYRLAKRLGRGGMGEVWQAIDTQHNNRAVALKIMGSWLANDEDFAYRFRREASLAAKLSGPHIVPIHRYGEIEGKLFIEMPIIDGIDLSELLHLSGPLAPSRAIDIIGQVADALDTAHKAHLVHRDVKPSNILIVDSSGRDFAYLIDFGLARAIDGTKYSLSGVVLGTLAYMAPERFDGEGDHRSDIYALGCVLYELLTSRPPFKASSLMSFMKAHSTNPPPRLSVTVPGLPRGLDAVIARAMAKNPNDRYPSAGALASAARKASAEYPTGKTPDARTQARDTTSRPKPTMGADSDASLGTAVTISGYFAAALVGVILMFASLGQLANILAGFLMVASCLFAFSGISRMIEPRGQRRRLRLIPLMTAVVFFTLFVELPNLVPDPYVTIPNKVVASINAGGFVQDRIASTKDGRIVYVPFGNPDFIAILDTASNTFVGQRSMSSTTQALAVSPSGDRVYIADSKTPTISIARGADLAILGRIDVPRPMSSLAVTPDGRQLYAVDQTTSDLSVVDTRTGKLLSTISVGLNGYGFHDVAITPDGQRAYVTSPSLGKVFVIDTGTLQVVATIEIGGEPEDIAITPNGKTVYISDIAMIKVLDTATNSVNTAIQLDQYATAIALSGDGNKLFIIDKLSGQRAISQWLNDSSLDAVVIVDTATQRIEGAMRIGEELMAIAVNRDGSRIYTSQFVQDVLVINPQKV